MTPSLDGRAWAGSGRYYATSFLLELFASRAHPGCYHYATCCADDGFCEESVRPVLAAFAEASLDVILGRHGLVSTDLEWRAVPAEELMLSGDRVRAGD